MVFEWSIPSCRWLSSERVECDWRSVTVLTLEEWHLNDQRHRTDGPAYQIWEVVDERVLLTVEGWYLDDQRHRIDEPAYREWQVVDGQLHLTVESWHLNGRLHRIGEPARREWTKLDNDEVELTREVWGLDAYLHRIDGPALREWVWDVNKECIVLNGEGWYLKGVKIQPRILRQPVRAIERWWLFQRHRRQKATESLLWDSGMIVFPGFMDLLKEC